VALTVSLLASTLYYQIIAVVGGFAMCALLLNVSFLDQVRLLLEVEDGAAGARRVQEALRAGLGIRLDCANVAAGSLPRFELKARRVVRR
jgi:hypothetical protein